MISIQFNLLINKKKPTSGVDTTKLHLCNEQLSIYLIMDLSQKSIMLAAKFYGAFGRKVFGNLREFAFAPSRVFIIFIHFLLKKLGQTTNNNSSEGKFPLLMKF